MTQNQSIMKPTLGMFALLAIILAGHTASQAQDPLLSWNDGPAKQAIVDLAREATETGGCEICSARGTDRTRTADSSR